jgi:hypothetical protein
MYRGKPRRNATKKEGVSTKIDVPNSNQAGYLSVSAFGNLSFHRQIRVNGVVTLTGNWKPNNYLPFCRIEADLSETCTFRYIFNGTR